MKAKWLAWSAFCVLLLSATHLLSYRAGYRAGRYEPQPDPVLSEQSAEATPLIDELSEIAARHSQEDDAVHQLPISEAEKEICWAEIRRHRQAEFRAAFERYTAPDSSP
jgi:hypothetical protein